MHNALQIVGLAAGLGLSCTASVGAVPVGATNMQEVAAATSPLQQARYASTGRGAAIL
jgi:hypothetical protein